MTSRDFCYWLQGFFEVGEPETLSKEQIATIRGHLALVFKHEIDPSHGPAEHQKELDDLHKKVDGLLKEPRTSLKDMVVRC